MMGLVCNSCLKDLLEINEKIELGSDDYWDESSLQIIMCEGCGVKYVGIYKAERRGGGDKVWHSAFKITEREFDKLANILKKCKNSHDPECGCNIHKYFQVKESFGWDPLSKIEYDENSEFRIRWVNDS